MKKKARGFIIVQALLIKGIRPFIFFLFFSFLDVRRLIKLSSLHETRLIISKEIKTILISLYPGMINLSYTLSCIKKMFILSFSTSCVCLVFILLIFCVIPLWDSATAHSPSSKELKPSSHEDARFSGRCTLVYTFHFILRHPSLGLSSSSVTLR